MENKTKIQSVVGNTMEKVEESQQLLDCDLPPVEETNTKVSRVRSKIAAFNLMTFPKSHQYSKVVSEMIALYRKGVEKRVDIQNNLKKEIKFQIRKYYINKIKKFVKTYYKIALVVIAFLAIIYIVDYFDLIDKLIEYVSFLIQEMLSEE